MQVDTHPPPPRSGWQVFLNTLSARSVGLTIGLAITVAVVLNPIFVTPFSVLLGRTLFVGMVLLLVFAAARMVPSDRLPRWLPSWVVHWALPIGAVTLAAPVFTAAVYLLSTGGSVQTLVGNPGFVSGFMLIAGSALVLGLISTVAGLARERIADAERRALALELERSRLEKQAVDARLALLQAQIEPHFLFNTLANVQALVESNSPRAAEVLKSLIAYLRAAMPRLHDTAPTLADEVALVRAYLALMQMRMPDRLRFDIHIDPTMLDQRLPPMTLLTLVENAVRHGIDPGEDGGHIEVGAARDHGVQRLWVADTGVGMPEHAEPGTGLANLRARVAAFFGSGARLTLSEQSPHGLRAEISWPDSEPPGSPALAIPQGGRPTTDRQGRFGGGTLDRAGDLDSRR